MDWLESNHNIVASKLEVLDLNNCKYLMRTPDLSMLVSLGRLTLEGCHNLIEIDPSIGKLKLLTTLNLKGCDSFQELPGEIGYLQALAEIVMPNTLHELSKRFGNLPSLLTFDVSHRQISKLPYLIGELVKLRWLDLLGCTKIEELPDSVNKKHHCPFLSDEEWRFDKIAKYGALCSEQEALSTITERRSMVFAENSQRQRSAQVHDFERNQHCSRFPPAVRSGCTFLRNKVLGNEITKRTWETIVRHASPCVINDNMYFCQALNKASIVFNSVMKVAQATPDGQIYQSVDILAHSQKNLKWLAYNNNNQWWRSTPCPASLF
ncbi:uncharacterized protein LOC104430208 isoform X5 [Eucalyptus grandis]|uniref:uncharacterized protein LOC104430208 isoform X5 n=1 Tax=Eucalyptus grandis TaxID=71139 RepID=UPI00192EBEE2|nr:uncharacterized protein LOC104430208 isoform X5 [Eucalyptus grandis]